MATAVLQPVNALQGQWGPAPSTPSSLLSLVFSAPLIETVPQHLHLLRSVHQVAENGLYKVTIQHRKQMCSRALPFAVAPHLLYRPTH